MVVRTFRALAWFTSSFVVLATTYKKIFFTYDRLMVRSIFCKFDTILSVIDTILSKIITFLINQLGGLTETICI